MGVTSTTLVHGTCHHDCPDSCGWTATVEGGVATKLRGRVDHPYSAGELCPKVNRFLDRVYSPDRLLHPLRRTGPKGAGEFEQITWDDALAEIAARLHDVLDRHGGEAILPFSDAGNQSLLATMGGERFFNVLGASRLIRAICGPTVGHGVRMTNGSGLGLDPLELRHSKLILIWGSNTRLTNRHLWPTIEAARADGAKVVVIDPIRTITAEAADELVQPRPGTDIALMLAMMHVLIRDGLVDQPYVDEHTVGFDELADHVSDWTPARAADLCGLDVATIERLAHDWGTIRPAAIRTLIGGEHHENGAMFYRTLAVLPALVGAWQDRGGGLARSVGSWQDALVDETALTRPDLLPHGLPAVAEHEPPRRLPQRPGARPDGGGDGRVELQPGGHEPQRRRRAPRPRPRRPLHRRPRAVPHRHRPLRRHRAAGDDPARSRRRRHRVGPPVDGLERGGDRPAGRVVQQQRAVPPPERRDGPHRAGAVRRRRGAARSRRSAPRSTSASCAASAGSACRTRRTAGRGAPGVFPTPSGRIELVSSQLPALGQPALPTYVAPRESPAGDPDLAARHPLQLLTPKHHSRFLNSGYSHLPKHGPAEGGPFVELDAVDAAARDLADGDLARVWNDRATVTVPVRVTGRLRPGVVAIPFGWWSQQHPDGRTANALTNDTLTEWGGGVAFWDTLVQVTKM